MRHNLAAEHSIQRALRFRRFWDRADQGARANSSNRTPSASRAIAADSVAHYYLHTRLRLNRYVLLKHVRANGGEH
jgi:hypothetical protein